MIKYRALGLLFFAILFVFTTFASAVPKLVLTPEQSSISYSISKYGSIVIQGNLKSESKSSLSGEIIGWPGEKRGLSGEIVLTKPSFDSDNVRRDEAVDEILHTGIRITPLRLESRKLHFLLSLNNVEHAELTTLNMSKDGEILRIQGDFSVDRKRYGLVFSEGYAATLDFAVASEFAVTFDLRFSANTDAEKIVQNSAFLSTSSAKPEIEPSGISYILAELKAWLGIP